MLSSLDFTFIGLILGLVYCITMFHKEGELPTVRVTCGPIQNGTVVLCGYHIHHWLIFGILAIVCIPLLQVHEVFYTFLSFSIVLVIQGLTYKDRCNFKYNVQSTNNN